MNLVIVMVRRGALHFSDDVYCRYFSGLDNVVMLRDGADLLVLPVRQQAAGGYVIKLRTRAGDRLVSAADFFRDNGLEDDVELTLPAQWDDKRMALIAENAFL